MPRARATTRRATRVATPRAQCAAREATPPTAAANRSLAEPKSTKASYRLCLRGRNQPFKKRIPLARGLKRHLAGGCQLVILTRRPLFGVGNGLFFPVRTNLLIAFQTTHRRIHRSAGQSGHLHDAEAIDKSSVERLQDHRRR